MATKCSRRGATKTKVYEKKKKENKKKGKSLQVALDPNVYVVLLFILNKHECLREHCWLSDTKHISYTKSIGTKVFFFFTCVERKYSWNEYGKRDTNNSHAFTTYSSTAYIIYNKKSFHIEPTDQ